MVKKVSKKGVVGTKDNPHEICGAELLRLKKLTTTNKVTLNKLLDEFEEQKKKLVERGITVNLERLAINAVMNIYRRQMSSQNFKKRKETIVIYGFMSGDSGIWDKAEQVRRQVKKFIEKNGMQAAIEAQMVDGDSNILDQRQQIYGKDNPKYLKPLDPKLHVLERTLYGFFRHNGEKTYKYGSIQTSDNRLARGWSKVKFYIPFQVPAILKEEVDDDIKLGSSSAEETMSIFKAVKEDVDIKAVIDATLKDKWTPINGVEDFHEKYKDAWDRKIFVKGIVAWINTDRPTPYGAVKMGLMNPDNEDELVIIEIPEQVSIDFGELSEVYVFGKTRRSKHYDDDKVLVDGDVNIQATGIFTVLPTPRGDQGYESGKEETPVEGWLE